MAAVGVLRFVCANTELDVIDIAVTDWSCSYLLFDVLLQIKKQVQQL